ncbi:extracellular matrix-binding ebh [Babesia caballi]|uniref:Extracellular matrix-binding ebh n=1 Tax=Babesia caballi TaxID=5871 RepID=A0AAV4LPZ7_BABCB|nr:extracellular matrix-binding ebh [Babesia caballi]
MGVQKKTKLTEWPEDLKDVIDWFLRNNDKSVALKNAVYQLEGKDVLENALGNGNLEGLFGSVAKGLQSFIGYDTNGTHEFTGNGIAAKSGYTSSYSKEAQWSGNLNTPHSEEAKKAAKLFLCYMPLLYICLIYMYWKCKLQYGGWGSETISGNQSGLNIFMSAMGFNSTSELQNITGSNVAESLTREPDGFSELKKAPKDEYYFSSYLGKVSEYVPYSPLATSLLDCPSNLKEAIDWILRVTGKDGGGGSAGNETILAKAITKLPDFQEAIEAASKNPEGGSGDVSKALKNLKSENTLGSIIENLTDGLRAFIGYGGQGQGIALVIDPLQQLRDGLLWFLNQFVDNLRRINVDTKGVTGDLRGAVSKGKEKFDEAVGKLSQITDNNGKISEVMTALKKVDGLKSKQTSVGEFASEVKTYLGGVLDAVAADEGVKKDSAKAKIVSLCQNLSSLLDSAGNTGVLDTRITLVKDFEKQLSYSGRENVAKVLVPAVAAGTAGFLTPLQKKNGYKSAYLGQSWDYNINDDKFAQIFLGCLPLYYYWLTYLYWKCKHGDWAGQILSRPTFKNFMVGQGYNASHLTTTRQFNGSRIATLIEALGMSSVTTTSTQPSHPELLSELNKKLDEALKSSRNPPSNTLDGHSLSALFYVCRYYFTGKQIMQSKRDATSSKPPISIREMLYWLSGLQFSPYYSDLKNQIDNIVPEAGGLPVADSSIASTPNSRGDTLTQNQMKGYLLSSCLSAPGVLGAIQGNTADSTDEPWLYSLFCNSMNLQYPSGSMLFNTLANYAYALQFQLYFLYIQCRTNYDQTYGWQWCRYGQTTQPGGNNSEEMETWICKAQNCGRSPYCAHNSTACEHIRECGQAGKASPLQAFLTDKLRGFHVNQQANPTSPNHLHNHPPGSMCHVKMGFTTETLTKDANATGWYIYYLLDHCCGFSNGPLPHLSEKLGCLTKRTPRTLGDLFGFIWHLKGQLFGNRRPTVNALIGKFDTALNLGNNLPAQFTAAPYSVLTKIWNTFEQNKSNSRPSNPSTSTVLSRSLEAMAPAIPFLYQLFMAKDTDFLPSLLFDLAQHCHKKDVATTHAGSRTSGTATVIKHNNSGCSQINDLWSLYQPVSAAPTGKGMTDPQSACRTANCGGYLYPLTHTFGSTFAPKYASSYLSWFLYLTDDLQEWLDELRMQFEKLQCDNCVPNCSRGGKCHTGPSAQCACTSIVKCSGILPLLYANGFSFSSAYSLKGGMKGSDQTKRTCQQFHDQLSAVIAPNESTPLFKLLTTIDDFLYMFRFYFFYNLSSFWIMYICIVLYMYFLRADLLHLKSHVHFPSSHGIPSIALLTTGKSTILTKLSKLTYFMP